MRSIVVSSILIGLLLSGMVAPASAQDATPTPDIGAIKETNVEATYERMTLVGMMVFAVVAGELDGTDDHPADTIIEYMQQECEDFKTASAPDVGDDAAMLTGTISNEGFDFEVVILAIHSGDILSVYVAAGMALVLDDFLPVIEAIVDRDPQSPEDWVPTLDDMPAGFSVSEDDGSDSSESPCI